MKVERSGFTLLEVLIALAVFAIGVTGMLVALGYHLRDMNYSKDHAKAVRIASREMNALRRSTYAPDAESEGEEGRFVWNSTAEEMDLDDFAGMNSDNAGQSDVEQVWQLKMIVSWSDDVGGEPSHKVKLEALERYEPE